MHLLQAKIGLGLWPPLLLVRHDRDPLDGVAPRLGEARVPQLRGHSSDAAAAVQTGAEPAGGWGISHRRRMC